VAKPDALAALLANIGDDDLNVIIRRARWQAARLAHSADDDARAWSQLFALIAAAAESALLHRRTGVAV
jgi:hypothetical protein